MKATTKRNLRGSAVIILMIVVMVGYYFYLSNREKTKQEENPVLTAVQEVLLRNLDSNYPPTPKEVIKYYSEITKCFYNEECTDGELEQLADKANQLYDEELLEHNDWGEYIIRLRAEIKDYNDNNVTISTYLVSASTDVEFFEEDDSEFARLHCIYTLKQGNYKQDLDEVFLLRKDEKGHWKIYGWENADEINPGQP